jgi:hypothetical protein
MKIPTELQLLIETKKDEAFLKENYDRLKKEHPDRFVAIKNGKVIAEGIDMNAIQNELKKIGEDPAITTIEFVHKKGTVVIL